MGNTIAYYIWGGSSILARERRDNRHVTRFCGAFTRRNKKALDWTRATVRKTLWLLTAFNKAYLIKVDSFLFCFPIYVNQYWIRNLDIVDKFGYRLPRTILEFSSHHFFYRTVPLYRSFYCFALFSKYNSEYVKSKHCCKRNWSWQISRSKTKGCKQDAHSPGSSGLCFYATRLMPGSHANLRNFIPATLKPGMAISKRGANSVRWIGISLQNPSFQQSTRAFGKIHRTSHPSWRMPMLVVVVHPLVGTEYGRCLLHFCKLLENICNLHT